MSASGDQGQNVHERTDARLGAVPQGRAVIVAGPTASGKSALAMALAREWGGVVINADSMQIYRELRIVTARPTAADEAAVPHRLYGVKSAREAGSVARWREQALAEMARARDQGLVPILCGGTGLYFASLIGGLADIPDPGDAARGEARTFLASEGSAWLHARLAKVDPDSAARLRPSDGQRVARAWEVWRGTGRGMAAWHAEAARELPNWEFAAIRMDPDRAELRDAVAKRFALMIEDGVIEEIRALLALGLDPALPAMRAHGVAELGTYLEGKATLAAAVERAVFASWQYSKRQNTWFRHHELADPGLTHIIHARYADQTQLSERIKGEFLNFVKNTVDAEQHRTLMLRKLPEGELSYDRT